MIDLSRPVNMMSKTFVDNKYAWYERIREERPVHTARISLLKLYTVARYDDCTELLKDPRVLRNRSTVTGGSRMPFPMPKSLEPMVQSMITDDDPNHRRLRELVRKAFRPQAIQRLEESIDRHSHELLDDMANMGTFELQAQYGLPIPMRMIGEMLGVSHEVIPEFQKSLSILSDGMTGLRVIRTLLLDLPATVRLFHNLIREKRDNPGEDILTDLIQAEHEGDRLTEDELVAMVLLLIVGGYETTVHLITNGIHTLLANPEQLARLRDDPSLIESAVEEILRHRGPIHGTKPGYASEDIEVRGVTIPRGKPIMPLLGAANHDPEVFTDPQVFDIGRTPNRHLGFGHGIHFCLGAHLARSEARLAIINLVKRFPDFGLAVPEDQLELVALPGWHRYRSLPLRVRQRRAAA